MSDGENTYTYDDEGNRTSKGATKYEWDHRNRLVKVVTPEETVEYVYDYKNRLVKRNDEIFVHDGWQIVCSLKDKKLAHRYLWGARQDELLCDNDNYTLCDHLGSVRKIVNASGKEISDLRYNAFGKLLDDPSDDFAFAYTGKLFDGATGLQWNINRWYDPKVGRWCSEDPIGFEAKDANLVRYVGNNSLAFSDLNGLWKANVHKDKTYDWSRIDAKYTHAAASVVAEYDEKVDALSGPTSPLPVAGDQSYHFNRNFSNLSQDSRILHRMEHYQRAVEHCKNGKSIDAARQLGIALHPLQDYYAHGDYGIIDRSPNGGLWVAHNKYGPILAGAAGDPWEYPDDITLDAVGGPRAAGSAIKTKTVTIICIIVTTY